MKTTVSEKGQITIPKPLRDQLGIRPGSTLEVEEDEGRIVATRLVERDPVDEVTGIIDLPEGTDAAIEEMRGPR